MEAVPGYGFLFRREGGDYFRRRIPGDVRKTLKRTERVESLKTRDFAAAKRLRNHNAVQTDFEIDAEPPVGRSVFSPFEQVTPKLTRSGTGKAKRWIGLPLNCGHGR
ncbi:MAG TPA: DUF6538 domain-containing protein [Caulobacteraceae bacterium]|jgi:hypothetical protein|nr:DUF6538 domain-containing protein [Caulobacteraceae bacterium]